MQVSFACTNIATFPENGTLAIYHQSDFIALQSDPDQFQGNEIRIAGRMAGIERSDQGALIRADWMLFPENPSPKTIEPSALKKARFLIFYPAIIDEPDGLWEGNEFLAIGQADGHRSLVDLFGFSQRVPYVHARCLHVWITGFTDLSEYTGADPLTFRYPPPLERTFCVNRKS